MENRQSMTRLQYQNSRKPKTTTIFLCFTRLKTKSQSRAEENQENCIVKPALNGRNFTEKILRRGWFSEIKGTVIGTWLNSIAKNWPPTSPAIKNSRRLLEKV